jgi:pimeloyl-ACP methyl ester carboxylesterase
MFTPITIRPMSPRSALKYLLSAVAIMALAAPPGTAADQSLQTQEKLIDVGGYNLNFRIIRGQGPAILLESGGGMDSNEWNVLAPRIAAATGATVIAYDRAATTIL